MAPIPPPRVVMFECYSTLIDSRAGWRALFDPMLAGKGAAVDADEFYGEFHRFRQADLTGPFRPFADILRRSLARALEARGLPYAAADGEAAVAAVGGFRPFPEVVPALRRLQGRFRLGILSNIDGAMMAETLRTLEVPFDHLVLSHRVGVYKPDPAIFAAAQQELGCAPADILHVAAGLWSDLRPARAMGWRRVWIDRRGEPDDPQAQPYHRLPDLAGLPELLGV